MAYYQEIAKYGGIGKGEPKARRKGREKRQRVKGVHETRMYVCGRERNVCRVDRFRGMESMHELRFRSLGGKVSRKNSIGCCGDGVNGCHGFMQRNEITYAFEDDALGAEGTIIFTPKTQRAADWMRINLGESIESPPLLAMEMAE